MLLLLVYKAWLCCNAFGMVALCVDGLDAPQAREKSRDAEMQRSANSTLVFCIIVWEIILLFLNLSYRLELGCLLGVKYSIFKDVGGR